jgi:hypothetical protein
MDNETKSVNNVFKLSKNLSPKITDSSASLLPKYISFELNTVLGESILILSTEFKFIVLAELKNNLIFYKFIR